jgi:hypothetical protein
VTGERIGDDYFNKLFDLRNEAAKQNKGNGVITIVNGKELRPQQSNGGCEPVVNDTRSNISLGDISCESLANDEALA